MFRNFTALPVVVLILSFSFAANAVGHNGIRSGIRLPSSCNQTSGEVCAEGKRIFDSECAAIAAGAQILHFGECENGVEEPIRCPVICRCPDPVCGEDMVTYWCGSGAARCAGVKVAQKGLCPEGNTGFGVAPRAAESLLLLHIVWLGFALFIVLGGAL